MAKRNKRSRKFGAPVRPAPGAPPGSVIVDPQAPAPIIRVIAYSPDKIVEETVARPDELPRFLAEYAIVWVNIDGLGDADVLREIAGMFQMHPLALEDAVNRHQRAKVEQYGDRTFLVTHM